MLRSRGAKRAREVSLSYGEDGDEERLIEERSAKRRVEEWDEANGPIASSSRTETVRHSNQMSDRYRQVPSFRSLHKIPSSFPALKLGRHFLAPARPPARPRLVNFLADHHTKDFIRSRIIQAADEVQVTNPRNRPNGMPNAPSDSEPGQSPSLVQPRGESSSTSGTGNAPDSE